jgi:hypothetical protein
VRYLDDQMLIPKIKNTRDSEEARIQADIIRFLRQREWYVKETHGNMYQSGFPDLYCSHSMYGIRWIEVKKPKGYCFTPAQMDNFPKMCANGSGVWIMTEASESQYRFVLTKPCNWHLYVQLMNSRGCP